MKVGLKVARYPAPCTQCGGKVKHGEKYLRYEYGHDPKFGVKLSRFCPRCCLAGPDIRNTRARARAAGLITKVNNNGGWVDMRRLTESREVEKALALAYLTREEAIARVAQVESYYLRRFQEAKELKGVYHGKTE